MFKNLLKPYLIGEIGINHNGEIDIAKRLIDAAYATQWDSVKFQKRNPDVCVPEDQKKIKRITPWGEMDYIDYKHKIEFGKKEYDIINNYCSQKKLDWSASVWDYDSLDFLINNYKEIKYLKIPSAVNCSFDFIEEVCKSGLPILLSLGMTDIEEMDKIVNLLNKHTNDFCIMHTNSSYPAPNNELNISLIPFMIERYNCTVGYSGHEKDLSPSVISAVLGAKVIERHITLSHEMWGTDHKSSLEVHAMDMLKKRITSSLECLGIPEKIVFNSEKEAIKKLRNNTLKR
jgi:N-acetylneuraminate synthase